MTKVIAIANQKGGVGKTSTTVNLDAGLVRQGFDVLLVDMDSQANLTMALGFQNPDEMQFTIANVLQKAVREETIIPEESILTNEEGIDLMPSNVQLSGVELALINEYGREAVLKQYIDVVRLNYDYILYGFAFCHKTSKKTTIAEAMINDACPMVIRIVFAIPCHNTASVAEPKPA